MPYLPVLKKRVFSYQFVQVISPYTLPLLSEWLNFIFFPHRVRAARTKKEGGFYVVLVRARGADPTKKKNVIFFG